MKTMRPFLTSIALAAACLPLAACGSNDDGPASNTAPVLEAIEDRTAAVGTELAIVLRASDADGDALSFRFVSDLPGVDSRARIDPGSGDSATFRYTPIGSDVGSHAFDFAVSDGRAEATRTVTIDVRSLVGGASAPVFRRPLGTGTTLDLSASQCVTVPIEIEDADSPGVTIDQAEPLIAGATLSQDSGLTATWQWCPTADQIETDDLYSVRFTADDGDNPVVNKDFLVVLLRPTKGDCPGEAPVVQHTPADASTVNDVAISARITDDAGLKFAPLLLYAESDPGTPPDLGAMTQLTMVRDSGSNTDGTWSAAVPNPAAGASAGASAELFYLVVARDNDDTTGDCDHVTRSPAMGTHRITVTNPGGGGGLGVCESCSADVQCGDDGDSCVTIGTSGASFCAAGCSGNDCPSGYTCSATPVTSVGGKSSRQCIPDSQSCTGEPMTCQDDAREDNDTLAAVKSAAVLPSGSHNLVSCPAGSGDDEDWYPIELAAEGIVTANLMGGDVTDLDLALVNEAGSVLASSETLSSTESLSTCLPAGRYYLRVFAFGSARNDYSLSWSAAAQTCQMMCSDDPAEDDDDANGARFADLDNPPYISQTNAICPGDDDWFGVILFNGQTLRATLTFEQTGPLEDLDILLYEGNTLLTQCTEQDPTGCSSNGQSGNSNEVFEFTATKDEIYYVVVHGFDGSSNLYDICIGLSSSDCPDPS